MQIRYFRTSIARRLVGSFVLIGLAPLALMTLTLRQRMASDLSRSAEHDLRQRLALAESQVQAYIDEHMELVEVVSRLPQVIATDSAAMQPLLRSMQQRHPDIGVVQVLNTEGVAIARGDDVGIQKLADRAWFRDIIGGKEFAYQTIISRTTGKPSVALSTRVVDGDEIVAVAEATLDLGQATDVVRTVRIGETGFAWLVDAGDKAMIHPDSATAATQRVMTDHPVIQRARAGDTSLVRFATDSGAWLAAAHVLPQGWVLVTQIPEAEAMVALTDATRHLLLVALGGALLALIVAVRISRGITRPLGKVVDAARRIARGDQAQAIDHMGEDELGQLAAAFRETGDYLRGVAVAADAVAVGDLTADITPRSEADVLSRNMGRAIASLRALQDASQSVLAGAQAGDLRRRASTERLGGAFADIARGINATLDAVTAPMADAAAALAEVADRDLTTRVTGSYRGDHARIAAALNEATGTLDATLQEVQAAATQVAVAGGQITSGSQGLARTANEQASALEQVSASLQELASTVQSTSRNAGEIQSLMQAVKGEMGASTGNMERLSDAMQAIQGSSEATARIVKAIDAIAFQTNLLALNAAVEAARAGDAGRGFAVVADEVRNLAVQAAEAAKQTSALIAESVAKVAEGVQLNEAALDGFRRVSDLSLQQVTLADEIAAATQQQAQGIAQVTQGADDLSRVTQAVAASSEESAAAAEELASQAEQLRGLIGQFRLTGTAAAHHAPIGHAAPRRRAHAVAVA